MTKKESLEKEGKEVTEGMETKAEMRVTPEELRRAIDYLAELNVLKRTPRSGWRLAGPPPAVEQDYVAAHEGITSHLGFILGRMEGLNLEEALQIAGISAFHDDQEIRTGERDKLASHYQKITPEVVAKALEDQTSQLPEEIGREIFELCMEANFGETQKAVIARDADILEASLHAKISHERGFTIPEDMLKLYLDPDRVQTRSAKRLMQALRIRKDLTTRWLKRSLDV